MATPTIDQPFLSEVEQMLNRRGEILVETCYSHAAGSRDIVLLPSLSDFQKQLALLPARTLVNVYRHFDLPLRGIVDEGLIQAVLNLLPADAEYLIVHLRPRNDWRLASEYDKTDGWLNSFQNDEGHAELEQGLRDILGEQVAIGLYPDWGKQYSNILWAVSPNADGSVQVGIY